MRRFLRNNVPPCIGLLLAAVIASGCADEGATENADAANESHDTLSEQRDSVAQARTVSVPTGQRLEARLLFADDFEDLDSWVHLVGDSTEWTVEDEKLIGRYGPGGSTLWSRPSFESDVLVEFDGTVLPSDSAWVTEDMPEGGKNLNFQFMVTGPDGGDILKVYPELLRSGTGPNGAGFDQYQGYFLTWTYHHARLRRSPGYEKVDENLEVLPAINTSYHFRLLRRDGRIRYWINDQLVLDYPDPDPWQRGNVGFTLWRSNVQIDNFRLYRVLASQSAE